MDKKEQDKYVDCVMSMCADYRMGQLSIETLVSNLKIVIKNLESIKGKG